MSIEAAFFGILSRDAEPKLSGSNKPYLRIIGCRVGEGDKAQWVSISAFDQNAIATADKFVKGAAVYCEGRLSLDKWKSKEGEDRSGLSVMAWHCRVAQIGRNKTKRPRNTGAPSVAAGSADFGGGTSQAKPHAELDDEIPW